MRLLPWLACAAVLVTPALATADGQGELPRAVRRARSAAQSARATGRAPALAAVRALDAIESARPGTAAAESARTEAAAVLERLYRIGRRDSRPGRGPRAPAPLGRLRAGSARRAPARRVGDRPRLRASRARRDRGPTRG